MNADRIRRELYSLQTSILQSRRRNENMRCRATRSPMPSGLIEVSDCTGMKFRLQSIRRYGRPRLRSFRKRNRNEGEMEIKALLQGTGCSAYLKFGRNDIKGLQTNLPEVKKEMI